MRDDPESGAIGVRMPSPARGGRRGDTSRRRRDQKKRDFQPVPGAASRSRSFGSGDESSVGRLTKIGRPVAT